MKIENWLEEHELDEIRNVGFVGLILALLPLQKAQNLNVLLWNIKFANGYVNYWEYWYKENINDDIYAMRCKIEMDADEYKALRLIDLYNRQKYFWLPEIKK